jgi:hypothetical protein
VSTAAVSAPDFDEIDFFRATPLYQNPYPYYEYLRAHGPVWREPHRGVAMVTEARISLERILDRMADIRISEVAHGPAHARRYRYSPIYMLRGLDELHLEFTPITDAPTRGHA